MISRVELEQGLNLPADLPYDPFRRDLYTCEELMSGWAVGDGHSVTLDGRIYASVKGTTRTATSNFSCRPGSGSFTRTSASPSTRRLPWKDAAHRRLDAAAAEGGKTVVGVEAKADEPFDNGIRRYLANRNATQRSPAEYWGLNLQKTRLTVGSGAG